MGISNNNFYTAESNPKMDKCLIQEGGRGIEILLVTSCFVTRDKLWPDGPLGSHIVFTFIQLIDLIHDTHHLCMRFRIDGIKAISRGISRGKQVLKFASKSNLG